MRHSVQDVWFPRAWFALWVVVQLLTGALLLFGQFVLWSGPNYDVLEANATLNFSLGSTVLVNGLLTLWFTIIPSDKKYVCLTYFSFANISGNLRFEGFF